MGEMPMDRTETTAVEAILRTELARGNRALRGVAPVISHMLETSGQTLVSEAIVARLRGMLTGIARQLLQSDQNPGQREHVDEETVDRLSDALASDNALLHHLYALAMEGHLTERLEQRSSVDPVLSPMLQELIASDQPTIAELAMNTLAAQSRFMQGQRRMALPLGELPSELLSNVLSRFEELPQLTDRAAVSHSIASLKAAYEESAGRQGLLRRLVSGLGGGAVAALELDHAGLALFVSAIAALTKQPRDLSVIACHNRQGARLALSLRAAGLSADAIERQFLLIEPAEMLPPGIADLSQSRAQSLLGGEIADSYSVGAV